MAADTYWQPGWYTVPIHVRNNYISVVAEEPGRVVIAIHIGLKKCASAAIQTFMSTNEGMLREVGIDYPKIGRLPRIAHHNLAYETLQSRKFNASSGTLAELVEYRRQTQDKPMVLSSEMFEGAPSREVVRLKRSLPAEDVKIIIFMRELLELMPSSYAQKVKFGLHTYDFDEFFQRRMQQMRVHFFEIVRVWAEAFGWKMICIRLLDRGYLTNGNVFDDLLSIFEVNPRQPTLSMLERPSRVNASPGWKVLESMRALYSGRHGLPEDHPLLAAVARNSQPNRDAEQRAGVRGRHIGHFQRIGRCAMNIADSNGWNDDRGCYLTREQALRCIDVYRNTIKALNEHLPCALPFPLTLEATGFKERKCVPDVRQIQRDELRDFYDELGNTLANDFDQITTANTRK